MRDNYSFGAGRALAFTAASLLLACSGALCGAQQTAATGKTSPEPRITEAIQQVSPDHIRKTIEKLVSFENRSTLSAQDEESIKAGKGIGAAREWIKSELERDSKECGGCLEVKTDSFEEQPADRIPKPTEITNVYAVLRGSDPEQANRIVLVTGHYDSRNSDNLNTTEAAPGLGSPRRALPATKRCGGQRTRPIGSMSKQLEQARVQP